MRRSSRFWHLATGLLVGALVIAVAAARRADIADAPGAPPVCGDGICSSGENCRTCPVDCACAPKIPSASTWTDHGSIFAAGASSEWDYILWGGFAHGVVRKDGRFHLYYQGSKYYDNHYGTVAFRSIGVATSDDGLRFSKYGGNPVLTWFPNNWLEEGAVSSGISATSTGEIAAFYGANTKIDDFQVNADGRLALSDDGPVFRDTGIALDHRSRGIWGSGDELFPVASVSHNGQWYVYYIPNGSPQARKLGVAWGSGPLQSSAGVTDERTALINAWGPASLAPLGDGAYALFLNNGGALTVWRINIVAPDRVIGPIATYSFPNMSNGTVLLAGDTWHLYYFNNTFDAYGVRTAPAF